MKMFFFIVFMTSAISFNAMAKTALTAETHASPECWGLIKSLFTEGKDKKDVAAYLYRIMPGLRSHFNFLLSFDSLEIISFGKILGVKEAIGSRRIGDLNIDFRFRINSTFGPQQYFLDITARPVSPTLTQVIDYSLLLRLIRESGLKAGFPIGHYQPLITEPVAAEFSNTYPILLNYGGKQENLEKLFQTFRIYLEKLETLVQENQ